MSTILAPDRKNQIFTPTFSAIGLLINKPIGIVTDEIKVSTENARPILSGTTVSWIYAVSGMEWTFPDAPRQTQASAKKNHPIYTGGIMPQIAAEIPIPNNPMKDALILLLTFSTLENSNEAAIIPTAKASSTALPYIADSLK